MEFTAALLSILTIHLMASISPGPDFAVVSQTTLLKGRKAGVICGIGVCVGILFHISYSLTGLAVILHNSRFLTQMIGLVGGGYLMYLGYKSIKGSFLKSSHLSNLDNKNTTSTSAFFSGLMVNVFNPKAAIYFISLFSVVVSPSMEVEKLFLIITLIISVQMSWYFTFIFIVTLPRVKLLFDSKVYLIDRLLGGLMLLMGIYMFISYLF